MAEYLFPVLGGHHELKPTNHPPCGDTGIQTHGRQLAALSPVEDTESKLPSGHLRMKRRFHSQKNFLLKFRLSIHVAVV